MLFQHTAGDHRRRVFVPLSNQVVSHVEKVGEDFGQNKTLKRKQPASGDFIPNGLEYSDTVLGVAQHWIFDSTLEFFVMGVLDPVHKFDERE